MKFVHWSWVNCYIWYSDEGTRRGRSPPRPLLAVPNVTVHPSTPSVLITALLYNGPLLCDVSLPVRGLSPMRAAFRCTFRFSCTAVCRKKSAVFHCWPTLPTSPSVLRPSVVISRKLSKIDPRLLWNTIRKLKLLILLSHSIIPRRFFGEMFWFQIKNMFKL